MLIFNSVYRGALNGIEKTSVGTFIQFIEQVIKVLFTIFFVLMLRTYKIENQNNILYIVTFGVTISVVLTFFIYMYKWKKYKNNIIEESNIRYIEIIKNIFLLSIPVTIIGIFGSINKNIDSLSLRFILKDIFDQNVIDEKYGILVSKVDVLTNLPIGLNTAITIPLLPKLSRMYSENDFVGIRKMICTSVYISLSIAIPIMFIFLIGSENILNLLYPNASQGEELLRLSSGLILLNMFLQIIMVYYNAIGKTKVILKSFCVGAILKLIINSILIRIPNIYEKGIIISSLLSDIVIILILLCNKDFKKINISVKDFKIIEIFTETFFMFFIIILAYNIGYFFKIGNDLLFVLACGIGGISYIFRFFLKKYRKNSNL